MTWVFGIYVSTVDWCVFDTMLSKEEKFLESKKIITAKIENAEKDNTSWNQANWPPGSGNPGLTEEEKIEKRKRKKAYLYDDINKFKIFMQKNPTSFDAVQNEDFFTNMKTYQNRIEEQNIMTVEMQDHVKKNQFFRRRPRRDAITATD